MSNGIVSGASFYGALAKIFPGDTPNPSEIKMDGELNPFPIQINEQADGISIKNEEKPISVITETSVTTSPDDSNSTDTSSKNLINKSKDNDNNEIASLNNFSFKTVDEKEEKISKSPKRTPILTCHNQDLKALP